MGSVKYLAEAGADALTYFEATGCMGLVAEGADGVYPVYHVLADILEFAGGMVEPTVSSEPLTVIALTLTREDRRRVLVSNLTGSAQTVRLPFDVTEATVSRLDLSSVETAMTRPDVFRSAAGERTSVVGREVEVTLGPFATFRLDG